MTPEFSSADCRPLIAALCPTIAALLVLLSRRHPNIREACTIIASLALFLVVISMVPSVLETGAIGFSFLTVFPGADLAFKVDACGLVFAVTSSSLWILVSLYSIGYMRSLEEHAQTRYYFSFAVAILGAIGMAFSANLVTMFVFYEILTVSTYASGGSRRDARGDTGRPQVSRLSTQRGRLPPLRNVDDVLPGRHHGLPAPGNSGASARARIQTRPAATVLLLHAGFREGCVDAHSLVASDCNGCANTRERTPPCGCGRQGGRFRDHQDRLLSIWNGSDARARSRHRARLRGLLHHHRCQPSGHWSEQPEEAPRVFDDQPAFLHHPGCSDIDAHERNGSTHPHPISRLHEDHAVPLRGCHRGNRAEEECQRNGGHRQTNASNDDRLHDRGPRHVRRTTRSRIHQQVAYQSGRDRSGATALPVRHPGGFSSRRRVLLSRDQDRVLREDARDRTRSAGTWKRRSCSSLGKSGTRKENDLCISS